MRIRIDALDTLFFRDGKPFSRGEETSASGVFPPAPSVFYGALRSLYFINYPQHIEKANQNNDPTKELVIKDIQICLGEKYLFHCPNDVVINKEANNECILLNIKKNSIISSLMTEYCLEANKEIKVEKIDGFLPNYDFNKEYLQGQTPTLFHETSSLLIQEPKVGIGRDNYTRTSKDGLLYRVGMVRINDLKIEIEFELKGWNLTLGQRGFIKLGGESKACTFEVIEDKKQVEGINLNSNIFKIYFSTPTIFKNKKNKEKVEGWLPAFLDKNLEGDWNGVKVKLIAAALGKPKLIGGFDIKKREPKPLLKMIPEGSVFYFKIIDNNYDLSLFKNLPTVFKLIDDKQKAKEGFGIAYLANTSFNI